MRKNAKKNTVLLWALLLLLIPAGLAGAAEGQAPPIRIEADRMESSSQDRVITFAGHVEARQGDLLILADTMTVTYVRPRTDGDDKTARDEDATARTTLPGTDANHNISKLVAEGNVEVTRQDWRAVGDRLEYFSAEKKVIMTGQLAKAWQDKNMVSGERIVLFLEEGKSVVESGTREGERVRAFIYPEGEPATE